jgi:hypothetical protein
LIDRRPIPAPLLALLLGIATWVLAIFKLVAKEQIPDSLYNGMVLLNMILAAGAIVFGIKSQRTIQGRIGMALGSFYIVVLIYKLADAILGAF